MRYFWHTLYLLLFQGESLLLICWILWSCLDCIQVLHCVLYLFQFLPLCFYLVRLFMLGGVYFVFLVSNFLLIYDYELFIIICLYCLCLKSRFLFFFTCTFFLFQGETLFLFGWSLWSCLDCIQVLHFVFYLLALTTLFFCWVIHVRGSIFLWFLFQTSY